jgi:hypothetical protein
MFSAPTDALNDKLPEMCLTFGFSVLVHTKRFRCPTCRLHAHVISVDAGSREESFNDRHGSEQSASGA